MYDKTNELSSSYERGDLSRKLIIENRHDDDLAPCKIEANFRASQKIRTKAGFDQRQ